MSANIFGDTNVRAYRRDGTETVYSLLKTTI